jgi:predicted nucleic acid-binding protein
MIFVDTSAIYALLDRTDANHSQARALWFSLLDSSSAMFTSNYVLVESYALTQNRLGIEAVRSLQADILPAIEIRWIDETLHALAVAGLLAASRRKLSLVDCSSFALMRQERVRLAFAFDRHFDQEGFVLPNV